MSSSASDQRRRDSSEAPVTSPMGTPIPSSAGRFSSSIGSPATGYREPIRSFIHGSVRDPIAPVDVAQNARTVRDDTAELASYLLSDGQGRAPAQRSHASVHDSFASDSLVAAAEVASVRSSESSSTPEPPQVSVDDDDDDDDDEQGPSVLSYLLRKSPPEGDTASASSSNPPTTSTKLSRQQRRESHDGETGSRDESQTDDSLAAERAPLLPRRPSAAHGDGVDLEGQKGLLARGWLRDVMEKRHDVGRRVVHSLAVAVNPSHWDRKAIWQAAVVTPVSCLPSVGVGLLLNILDALSYGMILFPLGRPIFAHLGSAGISIFYISTIVSQITFSSRSIFRGAVGSELIEVVPFFHNMAGKITAIVGQDSPDAVIATTIVSYALSSMMTGIVFYLMGLFRFGYMVGFIPRHILIGCIGGVGWFLVATGFEVSARLESGFAYNLATLQRLADLATLPLWTIPLFLAIALFYGQAKVASKYFLPLYILAIPVFFYFLVTSIDVLDVDDLRSKGWIFDGPPAGEPWWYFYTLYKFSLVRWDAVAQTIPAMLALTFFGILHVPINVPALALNCGEDNANLDQELRLHGYSNFLSGCLGSIQNYLVYANTVFFMRSGGDSRLAGFMLAALTFCVMLLGPTLIGYIPVMMVGTLIYDLGFELLLEAVWLPRKKFTSAEYLTVITIVVVMGVYDFVVGIGIGILLAFVSLIIQTSRVSPVRGTYAGDVVSSTVRRNPSQHHYLQQVGKQIYIIKLTGYLFFGTIVTVEEKIRALLDDHAFSKKPIKFLILDLWHVSGLDYSAAEAFNTISRLLDNKGVVLVLSGIDTDSQLGRNLRAVCLGGNEVEVTLLPDLNSALESCENELLKTLYARQEELNVTKRTATGSLDVPVAKRSDPSLFDSFFSSPRRSHLQEAARDALSSFEAQRTSKWQSFKEPLRLMLQIFQGLSDKNEDFWFAATAYFQRQEFASETVLFRRGEQANGFYLVERGVLRAEYDLPQGWLLESIVAGTTCGELPFFSDTERTATATVEKDCVVWVMDRDGWGELQIKEPEIAREFLRVSLKLTSERLSAITSYTLAVAG